MHYYYCIRVLCFILLYFNFKVYYTYYYHYTITTLTWWGLHFFGKLKLSLRRQTLCWQIHSSLSLAVQHTLASQASWQAQSLSFARKDSKSSSRLAVFIIITTLINFHYKYSFYRSMYTYIHIYASVFILI